MTETHKELSERIRARVEKAEAWLCPDCGSNLVPCPAKLMHKDYRDDQRARKCSNPECWYICEMGD